nr:hypothetical protein [Tanacetum cinerariifolium]
MLKVDVEPLALKLLNSRTAHSDYLRHTQKQAAILREVVEQGKSQNPLNNSLDHACCDPLALVDSFTFVEDNAGKLKEKLVDDAVTSHSITPEMLKVDVEPLALKLLNSRTIHSDYLRHTQKQAAILKEVVEQGKSQNPLNNSLDHACKSKPSTSASGSQPSGNTKKDKIQRPPSSPQKNKVKAHPRTVKSSWKNKNRVVEPKGTAYVQHFKLNANSKHICVKCNGCMLSDNHDLYVLNDVNTRAKSKSIKKNSKRKV